MKRSLVLTIGLVFVGATEVAGCAQFSGSAELVGYLEGQVKLGPMCPVERNGAPCPVPPEAYAAQEILLLNKAEVIARVRPDSHGSYRIAIRPGKYVADINRLGVASSGDVPREVEIRAADTTRLDIAIDTGIR
jgi:hypothetical protein